MNAWEAFMFSFGAQRHLSFLRYKQHASPSAKSFMPVAYTKEAVANLFLFCQPSVLLITKFCTCTVAGACICITCVAARKCIVLKNDVT